MHHISAGNRHQWSTPILTQLQVTPTTPPNNVSFEAVVLHRCAEGVLGRSQVWHGGTVMFGENPLGWHCSWLYAHLGPLVSPCSKAAPGPRPTIITPHGGPHSVYTAQYFMPFAYLVSLGVRLPGCLLGIISRCTSSTSCPLPTWCPSGCGAGLLLRFLVVSTASCLPHSRRGAAQHDWHIDLLTSNPLGLPAVQCRAP